jgi:hypothetical protein
MAQADGTTTCLTREERVAERLLLRHGLSPPVDVRELARCYADIEEVQLPATLKADAVLIEHPKGHRRPLIVLAKGFAPSTSTRKRFTLAHEIGHIVIPWHWGTLSCHPSETEPAGQLGGDYGQTEGEANRFASEILVPAKWTRELVGAHNTIKDIINQISKQACVSLDVARIKLMRCLPPGYVCAVSDSQGICLRVDNSEGTSLGTYIDYNARASLDSIQQALDPFVLDAYSYDSGQSRVQLWRVDCSCNLPQTEDPRESTAILREILMFLSEEKNLPIRVENRINGIVGSLNSTIFCRSPEAIYGALRLRFSHRICQNDTALSLVINQVSFGLFLAAKAKELAQGSNKKRKR